MEDFVVSARKYRPQSFETVVGQETITRTLLKAVEQNQLAQAFLFCGPRGVGKTTCARILARTVNEHALGESRPDEDFAFNIFELDAASNNTVDDIRSLIDQVRVPPQVGKYKVYIIDEVHMLSTSAFNAFLKTLEEPPPYAIFILATTEKHKVLPTILSRCQVFNFSRIQVPQMVAHLEGIAAREGIDAESDALHVIAEKADGALRDALSIFDQMVSFAGKTLTYNDVVTNLNVLDHDYYFGLVEAFLQGDRAKALLTFNDIINNGFDGHHFVSGLANHFRNLLFCIDPSTAAILEVGDNVKARYLKQASACEVRFILNGINILSDTDSNYKNSRSQRLLVELCLLKICNLSAGSAEKKNPERQGLDTAPQFARAVAPHGSAPSASPPTPARGADPSSTMVSEPPHEKPAPILTLAEEQSVESKHHVDGSASAVAPHVEATPRSVAPAEAKETLAPVVAPRPTMAPAATMSSGALGAKLAGRRAAAAPSLHDAAPSRNVLTAEVAAALESMEEGHAAPAAIPTLLATPFNLAQLWEAWSEYAASIREQDRQSYFATLSANKPVMREANHIEFKLENEYQLKDLNADKINILGFLREKLQNWQIDLSGFVDEDEDDTERIDLITPEGRYKAMSETNPALGNLRKRFDLDIELD